MSSTARRGVVAVKDFDSKLNPARKSNAISLASRNPIFTLVRCATPFSLNTSASFYNRRYFDWSEQRLGGRLALGYRLTHDLSLSGALRAENVNISDLRVLAFLN